MHVHDRPTGRVMVMVRLGARVRFRVMVMVRLGARVRFTGITSYDFTLHFL